MIYKRGCNTKGPNGTCDKCGERGEYHTVVANTRLFSRPLGMRTGEVVQHGGCWALDLIPDA